MKQLILASGSPRRRVLMKCMGLGFDVIPSDFDEHLDDSRSPQDVAIELGLGKAMAVAKRFPGAYTIGSDSIVVIDGKQLAKPADANEARRMLLAISGRTHQVVTSLAVVCPAEGIQETNVATVDVTFKELPADVIDAYIATGDPYDKAGGYARLHPLLKPFVTTIGDSHAVTGLSTIQLREILEKHGFLVPNDEEKTAAVFAATDIKEQRLLV